MKSIITTLAALAILCDSAVSGAEKPNIVFILLDDLGKEWVGCYGAEGIETPRVDELAAGGMRFNNVYSMPQCTPSRACFLTGQYPYRNGWVNHWDVPRWGLGYFDWKKNPSIGRMMKSAGYKTAAAGKWQLNDFREHPDAMVRHGFDAYCMWTGGEADPNHPGHTRASDLRYWDPYIHTKEGSRTYKGKFGPDIYNQFVLDFITENKDGPFFIYYPMALPHGPLTTTPLEPDVKGKLPMHRAMVRYIDHLTGKLVDHLDELGIRDNTLLVWTCDNGTSGSITGVMNGRDVRGGKTKTTENGVNAPFIVNCPGRVPAGVVSDALIDFTDMMPTFADFGGSKPEDGHEYDGYSAKDLFIGKSKTTERKWNLAMGSQPGVATDKGIENVHYFRDRVVREQRYKLFIGSDRKPEKLVDLLNDPAEKTNLIQNPELAEVTKRLYEPIKAMPEMDRDPAYTRDPDYPTYKKGQKPSKVHKRGHPKGAKNPKREIQWSLIWSDEFDKDGAPDPTKWTQEVGYVRNNEAQYYTKLRQENARVEKGNLVIEARKDQLPLTPQSENRKGRDKAEITSACLTTKTTMNLTYGRIEVRAKLPKGRGTWPAIWTLGTNIDDVGWPRCGEIDIMEFVGHNPDVIHVNLHTQGYNHTKGNGRGNNIKTPGVSDGFHLYATEWTEDFIRFYIDDNCFFTVTNDGTGETSWPFNQPQYLLLNLAIGGTWGGQKGIDNSIFPQQFLIDHVRVFEEAK